MLIVVLKFFFKKAHEMGNFFSFGNQNSIYTISNCKADRETPIDLPIFSVVGYGPSKEDALKSLHSCLIYNYGVGLQHDEQGAYFLCTKSGKYHYAYVSNTNGAYKCYLK